MNKTTTENPVQLCVIARLAAICGIIAEKDPIASEKALQLSEAWKRLQGPQPDSAFKNDQRRMKEKRLGDEMAEFLSAYIHDLWRR